MLASLLTESYMLYFHLSSYNYFAKTVLLSDFVRFVIDNFDEEESDLLILYLYSSWFDQFLIQTLIYLFALIHNKGHIFN